MSRGSRVGYGREIGPRCRGPKSPVNVELLQAIEGPFGATRRSFDIFGVGRNPDYPRDRWSTGVQDRHIEMRGEHPEAVKMDISELKSSQ